MVLKNNVEPAFLDRSFVDGSSLPFLLPLTGPCCLTHKKMLVTDHVSLSLPCELPELTVLSVDSRGQEHHIYTEDVTSSQRPQE